MLLPWEVRIGGVTPERIGIGEKTRAVRKPRANFPVERFALDFSRSRDGLRLAGFDESRVHPQPIGVRQIFSVGRDGYRCPRRSRWSYW